MKKNITRDEIADSINADFGLTKKDCLEIVNDIIEVIIEGLQKNKIVKQQLLNQHKKKNRRINRKHQNQ